MAKISSAGLRAPGPFEGLNVNFCKNPKCANFGVPETPHRTRLAPGAKPLPGDYALMVAGKGKPRLKYLLWGESMHMRSNQGIVEELDRLMGYLRESDDPDCHGCAGRLVYPLSVSPEQVWGLWEHRVARDRMRNNAWALELLRAPAVAPCLPEARRVPE